MVKVQPQVILGASYAAPLLITHSIPLPPLSLLPAAILSLPLARTRSDAAARGGRSRRHGGAQDRGARARHGAGGPPQWVRGPICIRKHSAAADLPDRGQAVLRQIWTPKFTWHFHHPHTPHIHTHTQDQQGPAPGRRRRRRCRPRVPGLAHPRLQRARPRRVDAQGRQEGARHPDRRGRRDARGGVHGRAGALGLRQDNHARVHRPAPARVHGVDLRGREAGGRLVPAAHV